MKKIIALFLICSLLLLSFIACENNTNETDNNINNDSDLMLFSGGDGTETAPYKISSADDLVLLASEINAGKDYKENFFSLTCDIDLNNIEWMPIGNGSNSFEGVFDGNGFTIKNLKITKGVSYDKDFSDIVSHQYVSGLFGSCKNSTIKNLTIDTAEVTVRDITDSKQVYAGVLLGYMSVDTSAEISNVKILNSKISANFNEATPQLLQIGGLVGYIYDDGNSVSHIKNIHSDVTISVEDGNGRSNRIGGIAGTLATNSQIEVSDCSSYLSVKVDSEKCYNYENYFGVFGSTQAGDETFSVKNIFSKVTVNKIYDDLYGYPAYTANAIIGKAFHSKQQDGSVIGGYNLKNVFGYVEQKNENSTETQISKQLYEMPSHALYTETNCMGVETLPTTHGFDLDIWDISTLDKPKIK